MSRFASGPPAVLLVDDHRLFAEAARAALEDAGIDVVAIAPDLGSALEFTGRRSLDLVLVDSELARAGQKALDAILRSQPTAGVVTLIDAHAESPPAGASSRGVRASVRKDASVSVFIDTIRRALSRDRSDGSPDDGNDIDTIEGGVRPHARPGSDLTKREWDVLILMVEGISNRAIAERLGVGPNTVNTHVQSVLSKLQVKSRLEAATFALANDLVVIGDSGRFAGVPPPGAGRADTDRQPEP